MKSKGITKLITIHPILETFHSKPQNSNVNLFCGTIGKVSGSPKSSGFIPEDHGMSVENIMAVYPPSWQTNQPGLTSPSQESCCCVENNNCVNVKDGTIINYGFFRKAKM